MRVPFTPLPPIYPHFPGKPNIPCHDRSILTIAGILTMPFEGDLERVSQLMGSGNDRN